MALRHLDSAFDLLHEAGLEVQDLTDAPFDTGMSVEVIAYEPTPGIVRERVLETVRPTVYLGGRMVRMGQVIVGTPAPRGGSEDTP